MAHDSDAPTALAHLQGFMQATLLQREGRPDASMVGRHVASSNGMSGAQRLAIYQRSYFARLLQCMQEQFKALNHALGPELFCDFAREYLRETPSRSPTLALLGHDFAEFLRRNRPDADALEKEIWVDFMIDLAAFEWRLYSLFDAVGAEQEGYAGADRIDDPQLRLQPCVRLCHYRFPVGEYYQQVAQGESPGFPFEREVHLALVRTNYRIGIFSLLPAQHHFLRQLDQLTSSQSVDDALLDTARVFRRDADSVRQIWREWQRGWIDAGFFRKSNA